MTNTKMVHLAFTLEDHQKLKEVATQYDMPMATYAKTLVLANLKSGPQEEVAAPPLPAEEVYVRKPRTVKRVR